MKNSILNLVTFVMIAGVITAGCSSSAGRVKKAEKNVTSANKDLEDANREYLADVENYRKEATGNIEANDRRIAELKTAIDDKNDDAREAYKKQIDDLEQKNRDMKKKIREYKADGKGRWEIFKSEFSHDMEALGQAFKDIAVKNVK